MSLPRSAGPDVVARHGILIHRLHRGTYNVGGFTTPDRTLPDGSSSHVDRERPYGDDKTVRLMVVGQRGVGFGIGAVDEDLHRNLGPGLPTAPGPHVYAYGLCGVIDNRGGTRSEIDQARANGLLIQAEIGDMLEVDGTLWSIGWAGYRGEDRHNVTLTLVGPA
jgi:hypothetical protein